MPSFLTAQTFRTARRFIEVKVMNILVTGAKGMAGTALCNNLKNLRDGVWEYPIAFTFAPLIGIMQNLILFIPFGFLLCGATDQPRTSRILLLGFLLSLSIELCQLLFRLGWFEVDDILHNVLGTYLGIRLYRRTVKRTST